jgi:tetratricopeptide (TPR) repeat protein
MQGEKPARGFLSLACVALACVCALPSAAQPVDTDPQAQDDSGRNDRGAATDATDPNTLRLIRDSLLAADDFVAALEPAEEVVAGQEPSADPESIRDLTLLARVRAELGEFAAAELGYMQAIELVEAAEGEFSITLVDLYRGLGRSYIRASSYPEAVVALEQAQHITQRSLGLFNTEQAGLLDDITTAYLGLGDTVEARRMQLERLNNAVRRFGAEDLRVVPFRYQLADYYERSRMRISAREQYEEAMRIQTEQLGSDSPELLLPLRELVKIDLAMAQGEEDDAYQRLADLIQRTSDAPPTERALSLAVLGDWAIVAKDLPAANDHYRQAWQELNADSAAAAPDALFGEPEMIDFIPPLNAVDRGTRSKPYAWGRIVLSFDVSADGRASNVTTVGTDAPPGVLEQRYSRRIRETHFRPRLVDGQPVPTANVEFTHLFRYYVDAE